MRNRLYFTIKRVRIVREKPAEDSESGIRFCILVIVSILIASFGQLAIMTETSLAQENSVSDTIGQSMQGDWGKIMFNLRYRYEYVDQADLKTANGDPVRLRLGYQTPELAGFQAYAEFLGNTPIFLDDYNDTSNGKTEYAVIGDPNEAALNQAWLSYGSIPDTVLKAGRQKMAWDNERFICPASWRQMEQTFDTISLLNTSLGGLTFKAAYIWNVLLTSNEESAISSPLLNLKYTFPDIGSLIGYGYWLDYNDPDGSGPFAYAYSSQTLGLRFHGSASVSETLNLLYTAEYGAQSDYGDNPKDFNASYYHVNGAFLAPAKDSLLKNISGKVGYEVFGSDNGVSVQTPLGANHKYNGWADIFGKTKPADGLRDLYGSLSSSVAGVKVELIYHDFQADAGGSDYGTEFDVKLTKKLGKNYTVLASWSTYNADEYKTDTDKFWLQLAVTFP